jgi:hypothetical protein
MERHVQGRNDAHSSSLNRPCGSQRTSPARNDLNTTQVMTETVSYPASASRGTPTVTPTREQSTRSRRGRIPSDTALRRAGAAPLSVRELNACVSPFLAACTPANGDGGFVVAKNGGGGRWAERCGGRGAARGSTAEALLRGPAGATYAVRAAQHPVYVGTSHINNGGARGITVASASARRTPPAVNIGATTAPPLMIAPENSTVRGLRCITARAPAAAAVTSASRLANTTAVTRATAHRRSVIEQAAIAAGMASATQADAAPYASKAQGRTATVCFQLPAGDDAAARSLTDASLALEPLAPVDIMKMRLQQPLSNVNWESTIVQRLAADDLVMRPPEKMKDGQDNAMFAQLSAFKMPEKGSGVTKSAETPLTTVEATIAASAASAEGGGSIVLAAAPQMAGLPLPGTTSTQLPPPAASTGTPPASSNETSTAATAAAAAPPPPPSLSTVPSSSPPPQLSNEAPAAGGTAQLSDTTEASPSPSAAPATADATAAAAAASPPNRSLPVLHASLREPTSDEKAEAEADRLLSDLLRSDALLKSRAARQGWNSNAGSFSHMSSPPAADPLDTATATGMAALYTQRQLTLNGGFYGWHPPPANVLLPDPSHPAAPTWAVLASATAQAAQQVAASQAIAQASRDADASPSSREGDVRVNEMKEPVTSIVRCADYHAPFQAVLHPESVEHLNAIPDISGAAVDTGVEDNGTDEPATVRAYNDVFVVNAMETTVKSFASQAVLLRDPLSLLACEHLAEDTVGLVARRCAYLSAMEQLNGALHGAALPPPPQGVGASTAKPRPPQLQSVLQPAAPPGEVFCTLSYQAKVLLATVLYMRALGALPTLLRAGPLTEYSPIVDKKNCIELVFYNPTEEERAAQEAQELQQDRRRRQSAAQQRQRESAASTAAYEQTPLARAHSTTMSPRSSSRAKSLQPSLFRGASPNRRSCAGVRSCPRSVSASASRGRGMLNGGSSVEDFEELVHLVPGTSTNSGRFPVSPGGQGQSSQYDAQQQQPPLQRRRSAVEELLKQSLTSAARRRSSSMSETGYGERQTRLPEKAEQVFGVTSKPPPKCASFTSLAGPLLRSAEPSLLAEDAIEVVSPASAIQRRPTFYNETGGAWLQRIPSQEAVSRVPLQGWSSGVTEKANDNRMSSRSNTAAQRQRWGSECCSGAAGSAAIPHGSGDRRDTGKPASPNIMQLHSAPSSPFNAPADSSALQCPGAALRRSSVHFALEDMKHNTCLEKPASTSFPTGQQSTTHPPLSPSLHRSVKLESTLKTVVENPKPVSVHGAGISRFPEGERELCVVLRAVVAQKSLVCAFGRTETVHVLPPLPPRTADDGVEEEETLLRTQVEPEKSEVTRATPEVVNPLAKFISGADARSSHRGGDGAAAAAKDAAKVEAKAGQEEAEKHAEALRKRARQAAAEARRQAPAAVDAGSRPAMEDYGDLVVAFVLSQHASELSGSVPDMMELETLRYRIFSLQGYSSADPSGMQAVQAAGRASVAATSLPASPSVDPHTAVALATYSRGSTCASSPLDAHARLQRQLSSYTAFQTTNNNNNTAANSRGLSPEASASAERLAGFSRASVHRLSRRASFFESELRKTDPAYTHSGSNDAEGEYSSDSALQQLWQRQHQQQRAAMQTRYPLYRASSVAESTLQLFNAEAKIAVRTARRLQRLGDVGEGSRGCGGSRSSSDRTRDEAQQRQRMCSEDSDGSGVLLAGLGKSSAAAGARVGGMSAGDATEALQEAERDLLRFRPMNMNSFHRELVEAVQYAIDLQARYRAEKVLGAFHM